MVCYIFAMLSITAISNLNIYLIEDFTCYGWNDFGLNLGKENPTNFDFDITIKRYVESEYATISIFMSIIAILIITWNVFYLTLNLLLFSAPFAFKFIFVRNNCVAAVSWDSVLYRFVQVT